MGNRHLPSSAPIAAACERDVSQPSAVHSLSRRTLMLTTDHPAVAAVIAAQADRTRLAMAQSNLEGRLADTKAAAEGATTEADEAGAEALLAGEGTGSVAGKAILAMRTKAATATAEVREIEAALRLLPSKLRDLDSKAVELSRTFDAAYFAATNAEVMAATDAFVDGFRTACLPHLTRLHGIAAALGGTSGLGEALRSIVLALPSSQTVQPGIWLRDGMAAGALVGTDLNEPALRLDTAWGEDPAASALYHAIQPFAAMQRRLTNQREKVEREAAALASRNREAENERRRGEYQVANPGVPPDPPAPPMPPSTYVARSYDHRQPGTPVPAASLSLDNEPEIAGEPRASWAASAARVFSKSFGPMPQGSGDVPGPGLARG